MRNSRSFPVWVLVLAVALQPALLSAKGGPGGRAKGQPTVGDKVRLSTLRFPHGFRDRKGRIVGRLVDFDDETVTVRLGADESLATPLVVPHAVIQKLEVSKGKQGILKGAVVGTVLLAGTGAVVGALLRVNRCGVEPPTPDAIDPLCAESVGSVTAQAAGSGAALGLILGAIGGSREQWKDSPIPAVRVGLAPVRGSGFRVSLAVGF